MAQLERPPTGIDEIFIYFMRRNPPRSISTRPERSDRAEMTNLKTPVTDSPQPGANRQRRQLRHIARIQLRQQMRPMIIHRFHRNRQH